VAVRRHPGIGAERRKPADCRILRINTADNVEPFATGFKDALAALGLVDGRNIRIEVRYAEDHIERLPELAQSLVRAKASVILAFGPPAIPRGAAGDEHDPDRRER